MIALVACGEALPGGPADLAASSARDLSTRPESGDLSGGAVDLGALHDLASSDTAPPDLAAPADLSRPAGDLASPFTATLGGIWLMGWSGGLDHFPWVRLDPANPFGGRADFLEPAGRPGWIGFWPGCSGAGQWLLTQKPDTIQLKLPPQCNVLDVAFTFTNVMKPGGWPAGAIVQASFVPSPPAPPEGYKFPDNQCDKMFTMCVLP